MSESSPPPTPATDGPIALMPAAEGERAVLETLAQLYCYDWSEMIALDVDDGGRFADLALAPYWQDDWKHPLIRVEGKLAGFALVAEHSKITGKSGVFDMVEFFVMRKYRRRGAGLAAAFAAFDRFKGPWEVRQRQENAVATAFWRRTISLYARGAYEESLWTRPEWTEVVQTFSTIT